MLTNKEKEILAIIAKEPTIDQNRLAELLDISRSTVAVHISSLQKKGYLLGRGYIVKEDEAPVLGIGAALIDIYGFSQIRIRAHYDHPASIRSSFGGVMHNIISNYVMLGGKAKLITAYGDDAIGKSIADECTKRNIDVSDSLAVKGAFSGIFMQVQDENNDMYLALCDMSILDYLDPAYIEEKKDVLLNARAVVLDASLKQETIAAIVELCRGKVTLIADPISDNLAVKLAPYLADIDLLKANKGELENLAGLKIKDNSDVEKAADRLLAKGLKRLVASLGSQGIMYQDQEQRIYRKFKKEKMANASGAGDALSAAFVYGLVNDLDLERTIDLGLAAGIAAVRSDKAINENMSVELLDSIIEESKK